MKKKLFSIALALIASISITVAFAQDEKSEIPVNPCPKWVTEKGYWVIESNIKSPKVSTLYFYNDENLLVYKEKIEGIRINLKRKKTKMQLKHILEQSLALYEQKHKVSENELLAKNMITGK